MIRDINKRYRKVRNDVREYEPTVTTFKEKIDELSDAMKRPVSYDTLMEMCKIAEALPSEIREVKLRCTKAPSHINGEQFRYCVRLRSNNGFVDVSVINEGNRLLHAYYELAELMIKYTTEHLQANPSETNNHKAICLFRDIARFQTYIDGPYYDDRMEIDWERISPDVDYLTNGYTIETVKDRILNIAKRDQVKGLYIWNLKWDVDRLLSMVNAMEQLIARIAIFGIARLELTPEQLDAIDPQ
ncbi:hypothetical protein [Vibrio phage VP4B]|uniref:Uncharacterized protein n=1 Tax=Vibrio phage VP4B TaxID=1262540 RepID=V9LZW3_9CAUD|nr:hypothetical protein FDJ61_gp111 [Vibrio phage VP4B]AGB07225.1 hypothetical protein [Vibrio phage VP4B]